MSDWNRKQVVEALVASGLCKQARAYELATSEVPHTVIASHPVYRSEEVRAWIAARVIASGDDAPR